MKYYLQDSRSYSGNSVIWWREGRGGYTTDIGEAHIFTFEEAIAEHNNRSTDQPWPCEYVNQKIMSVVDSQRIKKSEAGRFILEQSAA